MFPSLRQRLMLSHLIVIILAMGLVALTLLSFLENYFLQSTEDSLVAQARFTVQTLIPNALTAGPQVTAQAPLNNAIQQQAGNLNLQTTPLSPTAGLLNSLDLSSLADTSLQLGTQLDTRIRLLNTQGRVLVDSAKSAADLDLHSDPLVRRALQGEYAGRIDTTSITPTISVAMPVLVEGQSIGVAYLSQSLRDVLTVLNDLRVRLLLSTLIALALSAFVGWWLSRRITHPVQQLTIAAEAVAAGKFDQAVQVNSHDEIGRLSNTFNDMTARLQAARQM